MSDQAYFELQESINNQNNKIWSGENPKDTLKMLLYPEKILMCKKHFWLIENIVPNCCVFQLLPWQHNILNHVRKISETIMNKLNYYSIL